MSGVGPERCLPLRQRQEVQAVLLVRGRSAERRLHPRRERQSALLALGRFGWRQEFDGDRILASRLAFRTAEGDEMVFARSLFDVRDRETRERAHASHPDLDRQDDGSPFRAASFPVIGWWEAPG